MLSLALRNVGGITMKVTCRSAKMDKAGLHNDRNFDIGTAAHIDSTRTSQNRYYTYNGDHERTFLEIEQAFYKEHFSDYIESQNERNTKAGHKERNRSIEDYYFNKKTRPEDVLLQIGDVEYHATGDELWECALKYKDRFEEQFGDKCKILDMALHLDEATPHVHIRRTWLSEDARGHEQVNMEKCLRELDIILPDGSKPIDKYNNQKITFSKLEREMFIKICEEEGFEIDRTNGGRNKHLSVEEYKEMKVAELNIDLIQEKIEEVIKIALENERLNEKYRKELESLRKKSLSEKMSFISDLSEDIRREISIKNVTLSEQLDIGKIRSENEKMRKFIIENNMLSLYENNKKDIGADKEKYEAEEAEEMNFF